MDFIGFPKITRFNREVIVTEKIDGTNAQIHITDDGQFFVGSRTRWITPEDDNFGFARWAHENKDELMKLGPGSHFGEWWGKGIQRKYGLEDKRFSLFNVSRWGSSVERPSCCSVVPELWRGQFEDLKVSSIIDGLIAHGSVAAPGFLSPEGIVVYHVASGQLFKKTVEKDGLPKGASGG